MKTVNNSKIAILTILYAMFFALITNSSLNAQQEKREVPDFTGVAYSLPCQIEVKLGNKAELTLEGSKSVLEMILTKVENGTLKIYTEGHVSHLGEVKIYLTVVNLEKFSLSGSGDVIFSSVMKSDKLVLEISGSGNLEIPQLTVAVVELKISGSGSIKAGGTLNEKLVVNITGSGDVKAAELQSKDVTVKITGSGSAEVNAQANLKTNIVGSGSVHYKGNPLIDAQTVGSGSTKPL
jgi:hypothetical protein